MPIHQSNSTQNFRSTKQAQRPPNPNYEMYKYRNGSNLSIISKILEQQDKNTERLYKMRKSSKEVLRDSDFIDQTKNALIANNLSQPYFNNVEPDSERIGPTFNS